MNILLAHNSLNDSVSVSGVLRHYSLMAREWIARGHPTDFLVASAGFAQLEELCPQAGRVSSDRVFDATGHLASTWRYLPAYAWRLITSRLVRLPRRYHAVYASNFVIFDLHAARTVARRHKAALVVKLQHLVGERPGRRSLFDRLFVLTERWGARKVGSRADLMMCLSAEVESEWRRLEARLGLARREVHQVGCGLDLEALQEEGRDVGSVEHDVVVLGRMHRQKGVFDLPRVWRRVKEEIPSARLLAIGEGPHREAVRREMEGVDPGAEFVGGIPERRKNRLLSSSRLALSLSREEGWGLSVTECLAAGLPVVAYRLPVYSEIFGSHVDCVEPGDAAGAARRICHWLRQDRLREEQGRANRLFARRFDYRQVAARELELIGQAVERRRKPGS